MSEKYVKINSLSVSRDLLNFINEEALPGTNLKEKKFWAGLEKLINELASENKDLIDVRRKLQLEIDRWHLINKGKKNNLNKYKSFLKKIGYLKKVGNNFKIKTKKS